jgi:cyclase
MIDAPPRNASCRSPWRGPAWTIARHAPAGADKISINSGAATPELIGAAPSVSAASASSRSTQKLRDRWEVQPRRLQADRSRCCRGYARLHAHAGEIVLNSIDADGTKAGYDLVIRAASANPSACPWSPWRRRR